MGNWAARASSRFQGFHLSLGRRGTEGWGDPANMEQARPAEDRRPIYHARLDVGESRVFSIVEHAGWSRRCPVLDEIDAGPLACGPNDMAHVHAKLAPFVGNHPAQRVVGQPADPGRGEAKAGDAGGHAQLGPADRHVEVFRLL